jgi:hypothetical protein
VADRQTWPTVHTVRSEVTALTAVPLPCWPHVVPSGTACGTQEIFKALTVLGSQFDLSLTGWVHKLCALSAHEPQLDVVFDEKSLPRSHRSQRGGAVNASGSSLAAHTVHARLIWQESLK